MALVAELGSSPLLNGLPTLPLSHSTIGRRPRSSSQQTGLMGPRAPSTQQAHIASYLIQSSTYAPTDIFDVLHTLSISSPTD